MLDTEDTIDLMDAFMAGEEATRLVAEGGEPDVEKLERYARAMEALRAGVEKGKLCFGWVRPTREDVQIAFQLVDLVRAGASREDLVRPAWHAYRVTADPGALYSLGTILPWLAGEPRAEEPTPEQLRHILDLGAAFFGRGGEVAGFTPTPEDITRVDRLREIATAEGAAAKEERKRIAKDLWARYPQDNISAGILRMAVRDTE
jgi:hypothetical protein